MDSPTLCGVVPEDTSDEAPRLEGGNQGSNQAKIVSFTKVMEQAENIDLKTQSADRNGSWARPRGQAAAKGALASDDLQSEKRASRHRSPLGDGICSIEDFLIFHFQHVQQDLVASQERMLNSILPVFLKGEAVRAATQATTSGDSGEGGDGGRASGSTLASPSDMKLTLAGIMGDGTSFGAGNSCAAGDDAAGKKVSFHDDRPLTLSSVETKASVGPSLSLQSGLFSMMPVASLKHFGRSRQTGDLETGEPFQLLDVWTRMKQRKARLDTNLAGACQRSKTVEIKSGGSAENLAGGRRKAKRCQERLILHPSDLKRTIWDMMSLVLVLYDMVMIPLAMFDLPETPGIAGMAWITRVFWTIDIPLAFLSGYVTPSGSIMLDPYVIVRRYMRTWFLLDTFIVGIDWIEILVTAAISNIAGVTRVGKVTRVFRIVRMLRLLRLARIGELIAVRFEAIHNERAKVFMQILKLCIMMCATAHLLGCLWYSVGKVDPDHSWISAYGYDEVNVDLQYLMSLRWAFSQFSGGMDEIQPKGVVENLFAAFVFVISFWCGAVFVSLITSVMTKFFIEGHHNNAKLTSLRNYLEQHKISKNLVLRLTRNAQHALCERQRRTPEDEVEVIQQLSEPLRAELRFEIYAPGLGAHPFFSRYIAENPHVMKHVCHHAMSMGIVSSGDTVFEPGETPENPRVYFVNHGRLAYTSASGDEQTILPGGWACEAVLWTNWTTLGTLMAVQDTRLYILDAAKFQSITSSFEHTDYNPAEYAEDFVDLLNQGEIEISDLPDMQDIPITQGGRGTFRSSRVSISTWITTPAS